MAFRIRSMMGPEPSIWSNPADVVSEPTRHCGLAWSSFGRRRPTVGPLLPKVGHGRSDRGRSDRGRSEIDPGSIRGCLGADPGSSWGQSGSNHTHHPRRAAVLRCHTFLLEESLNAPTTVLARSGVDLGWIWGRCGMGSTGGRSGVDLGFTRGRRGVDPGSIWACICGASLGSVLGRGRCDGSVLGRRGVGVGPVSCRFRFDSGWVWGGCGVELG